MRRIAWWLAVAGAPIGVLAQSPRIVIDESFVRFDPTTWVAATNGTWQSGAPTTTAAQVMEGRTSLVLESELAGPMRRGYLWEGTFRVRSALIEFGVMPLTQEGAPAEAILLVPFGDAYLTMALHATEAEGPVWARIETAGWAADFPIDGAWAVGRWYSYAMDVGQRRVRLSISDDAGRRLWSRDFPWESCEYAPQWTVGMLQWSPAGVRMRSRAAFDGVRVTQRCGADIDGDGRLTALDFSRFTAEYALNDCSADMTDDVQIDIRDAIVFVSAFAAGCP